MSPPERRGGTTIYDSGDERPAILEARVRQVVDDIERLRQQVALVTAEVHSLTVDFAAFRGRAYGALIVVGALVPVLTAVALRILGLAR